MATITIRHRPDLTPQEAEQIFRDQFAGKYEVYPTSIRTRDFVVKKSEWSGVGVRVKQEKDSTTTFVFTAMMPNMILNGLFGGLIAYLFLRKEWKALEAEVSDFIDNTTALAPQQQAA
jgi:hypothetical protein